MPASSRNWLSRLSKWAGGSPNTGGPDEQPLGDMRTFLAEVATRGFRPRHVLDVGAHRGAWSQLAATVFPEARFTLIEPQQQMQPDLDAFCASQPGSCWVQAGAGAESGELELTVWDDLAGSSFAVTEREADEWGKERRRVPVITIDSLIGDDVENVPELAKLDVQGFELEVLRGAEKLFGSTELFILEVSFFRFADNVPPAHEVVQFMAERGYWVYGLCGFLRRPFDGALGQADIAFARECGTLRKSNSWL